MDKLMTIKELSQSLSIKINTLYAYIHKGEIPYYKINGLVRFNLKEIEKWLNSQSRKPKKFNFGV